jgi:hypothetical protein
MVIMSVCLNNFSYVLYCSIGDDNFFREFVHIDFTILVGQGNKLHVFFIFDYWFVLVPSVCSF